MSDIELEATAVESAEPRLWRGPYALRALRHRNYFLLWFGQLISLTGTWMQGVALPWLVLDLTQKPFYLGLVGAVSTIPALFVTLPAGVIADRFSKRKIVIITQTMLMLQAFALAVLCFTGRIEVWHVLVLGAFAGFANAVDMPTRQSMVVELVGKEDLMNAVALSSAVFNSTRVFGPAVGASLIRLVGTSWCFFANGISYLAAIAGLLMMTKMARASKHTETDPMMDQIKEGFRYIRRSVFTRDLLIMTGISTVFASQYGTLIPAFAKFVYGVGATGQAVMMSAAGVGAFVGGVSVAVLGHMLKQRTIVFFGAILMPVSVMAFAVCPTYPVAIVCLVFVGFGMMLFLAVSNSIIQVAAPQSLVGRVTSVRALLIFGVGWVGALQIGTLAQYVGVRESVFISGIITLMSSIYYTLRCRQAPPDGHTAGEAIVEDS